MTQCAKIIVGFTANVGNVFIKRFFFNFPLFLRLFLNNVYYIYDQNDIADVHSDPHSFTESSPTVSAFISADNYVTGQGTSA